MNRFWPAADPRQDAYERLRSAVLAGVRLPDELAAARFARRGLAGLIIWPDAEPVFNAHLVGAARAAWTPYAAGGKLPAATRQHRTTEHGAARSALPRPPDRLGQQR
jgi:hypothetical protein